MGPSRAEVGFGSRLVGCVRRFCPPPLLWSVFGPSSVRFFFSLTFSGFARSGLDVLVLVFSLFPLLFCVPRLVSRLSSCHLISIVGVNGRHFFQAGKPFIRLGSHLSGWEAICKAGKPLVRLGSHPGWEAVCQAGKPFVRLGSLFIRQGSLRTQHVHRP